MDQVSISKPIHRILADLTGEQRIDLALQLATKDLVRLKLKEVEEQLKSFEARYHMNFDEFKRAWDAHEIPNRHYYPVEQDYWEWEAASTDEKKLRGMLDQVS